MKKLSQSLDYIITASEVENIISNIEAIKKQLIEITLVPQEKLLNKSNNCVGDVVMKDFSITKVQEAKDRLDEVFGIAFHVNGSEVRFVALDKSEEKLMFKIENTFISEYLPLYNNISDARNDMNGKMNSEIIKNAPDFTKEKYPSMGYCMDYNRFGFDKGMWYLPSIGELEQIYKSKEELNKTLRILGKEEITDGWYTSSSDCCAEWCWWFCMGNNYVNRSGRNSLGWVRPCFKI